MGHAQEVEVVDAGGGWVDRDVVGSGFRVGVPADPERDREAVGAGVVADFDVGQVERVLCRPGRHADVRLSWQVRAARDWHNTGGGFRVTG